jgi:hypothetical protein
MVEVEDITLVTVQGWVKEVSYNLIWI